MRGVSEEKTELSAKKSTGRPDVEVSSHAVLCVPCIHASGRFHGRWQSWILSKRQYVIGNTVRVCSEAFLDFLEDHWLSRRAFQCSEYSSQPG